MRALLFLLSLISIARAELDVKPLEAWIARQKDMKSLEADFVQERKLPSLKKPVSTPGRLRMERPGKLLWESNVIRDPLLVCLLPQRNAAAGF